LNISFFLGGGLSPEDMEDIRIFKDLGVHAIDINSGFEKSPGIKDTENVNKAINKIKEKVYE
jgi:phosphoribosylanthranilate isomerase